MTAVVGSRTTATSVAAGRARWVAVAVVGAGSLMNVLDTTIVGVALPAIATSPASWPPPSPP